MLQNAKLLLMDDEPLIRLMLASALEDAGAMVREAGSCAEGLEAARASGFDAAIFDHRLPDGNCLDLLKTLRQEGCGLPVVILSGEYDRVAEECTVISGIEAVLPKPPDVARVIEAVERSMHHVSSSTSSVKRLGRYRVIDPEALLALGAEERKEWLAFDLREKTEVDLYSNWFEFVAQGGHRIAILGANALLKSRLSALNRDLEFADEEQALEAVSRHGKVSAERSALMRSVIQGTVD